MTELSPAAKAFQAFEASINATQPPTGSEGIADVFKQALAAALYQAARYLPNDREQLASYAAELEGNPCSAEVEVHKYIFAPGSAAMARHYVPLDWRALIQQARNENKSISDLYHKHFIFQLANLDAMINNVQKQASLLSEMHFSFMKEISKKVLPPF